MAGLRSKRAHHTLSQESKSMIARKESPLQIAVSPQSTNERMEADFASLRKCTCKINCREKAGRKYKIILTV